MINQKDIAKMARQIFKKSQNRGVQNPKLTHPTREWWMGLVVGAVIFGVSAGWSANTYLSYRDVSILQGNSAGDEIVIYRESMVKSALEMFDARRGLHTSLMGGHGDVGSIESEKVVEEDLTASEQGTSTVSGTSEEVVEESADEQEEVDEEESLSSPSGTEDDLFSS